ncbi:MAG: 1-acyl-sn-glycerol-3-phosphate acyltransferase [Bacteroidota bacterium]
MDVEQHDRNKHPEISRNFIDLDKVLADKNPTLKKVMPGFVLSYLRRVIHQEEVNEAIYSNRDKFGVDFVNAILDMFGAVIKVKGLENLPETGRQIIASNHPLGGLDGMALMSVVGRKRRDFLFPVNDLLMYLPNLRELFIPINKHGSNADNIQIFNDTFASDVLLLYFPAGLVSRKQKGKIMDVDWRKTFLTRAIKYKRDVVPVHISGRNTNFFYGIANWRKRLSIKANIEMLYLVDEMFRQKNKVVEITFGKTIPIETFDKRHSHAEWAELLKKHVYALGRGEDFPLG